jgi:hypothetical protein
MPEFEVPKSIAQKSSVAAGVDAAAGDVEGGEGGTGERVMAGKPDDRRIA